MLYIVRHKTSRLGIKEIDVAPRPKLRDFGAGLLGGTDRAQKHEVPLWMPLRQMKEKSPVQLLFQKSGVSYAWVRHAGQIIRFSLRSNKSLVIHPIRRQGGVRVYPTLFFHQ